MLIDSHAHLNFNAYKEDADQVIQRAFANNIWMVNVGSQYETSKRAVGIAQRYTDGIFAAVGLHPIHLETNLLKIKVDKEEVEIKTREEDFDYEKYKNLAQNKKVVAIGEIGLDYYWKPKTKNKLELFKAKQKEVLLKQLELAKELNLPVIFHCRFGHSDLINILESFSQLSKFQMRGVIHCFAGNLDEAKRYLKMGFYLGFNGLIFKLDFDDIIKKISLEKILIETDCPYLTPPPMTGRNEPFYIKYVAEKIAKIKNVSFKKVEEVTAQNARNLFRI